MLKDDKVYIGHMLDKSREAVNKVKGRSRRDYDTDENLRYALVHLVQIIGEAARRISEENRKAYSNIPWSKVIGMRHKIVHDYIDVDFDIVWEVVNNDLPKLVTELEKIVSQDDL